MLPNDIDDLFRDKLDGHETPPGDALWARLQHEPSATPEPNADRLDQLFRGGLQAHATAPGRALWERLEDEHLRPRKRRAAAWWPMALAAVVALLLVAGGVGLWTGRSIGTGTSGSVASQPARAKRTSPAASAPASAANQSLKTQPGQPATATNQAETEAALATISASKTTGDLTPQKNVLARATRSVELASTAPKARRATAGQLPRRLMGTNRQPDAATDHRPQVARTTPRPAPATPLPSAADEPRPTPETSTIALATKPAPTPEIVRTVPAPAASLASASELITVDVRNGGTPAARPAKFINTAVAEAPAVRRGLGGRLLQQAGHLARGERVSLAEVTGLPENVTLQATLAGRSISKSIRL